MPANPPTAQLSAAIVLYRSDPNVLQGVLDALSEAVRCADIATTLWLVDNDLHGAAQSFAAKIGLSTRNAFDAVEVISGQGNIGFGRAHNLVIERTPAAFHLILNPDAVMEPEALIAGIKFLSENSDVILAVPAAYDSKGALQFLCRRYPSLLDLFLRGFAPEPLRRCFGHRLAHYQMQEIINEREVVLDPPIVSGSFMLFKSGALKKLAGFDARYFLYFEDYDLSLRAHQVGRIAYLPSMRIVHLGGNSARKGIWHIRTFIRSAAQFFSQHGWRIV